MGPVIAPLRPRRSSLSVVANRRAHGPDRNQNPRFWPCYLCCLRDPGSVHHRPARAMLDSLLFEPCSSSPGHLRPCAPCCVGHAESQPYARSDTAPVVCACVFCCRRCSGSPGSWLRAPSPWARLRHRRSRSWSRAAAPQSASPSRSFPGESHPPPLLLLSRGLRKQPEEGSSDEAAVATMPESG